MNSAGPRLPLADLVVLDVSQYRAGPTAARQLADWGADVIKIEPPVSKDSDEEDLMGKRHGFDFQNLHRNKRSMTLNLKAEEGRAIFFKLVEKADIVLENYRTSVKRRLGIDYEACRKINPRIIYGSISGFGQTGPDAERPGVDQIIQGVGGLMSVTGLPGQGPVRVGIPLSDLCAGLFLFQGLLLALLERGRTGKGQWVHTSLLEGMLYMLDLQAARWLIAGEVPGQAGNDHPTGPNTGLQPTKDGYINNGGMWPRFCKALDAEHLLTDPDYATREKQKQNRDKLHAAIREITRRYSSQEVLDRLNRAGIPCGPVYTIDQTFADPQVQHLGIVKTVEHPLLGSLRVVGQPVNLADAPQPDRLRMAAPDAGQHTSELLASLNFDPDSIRDLRDRNII